MRIFRFDDSVTQPGGYQITLMPNFGCQNRGIGGSESPERTLPDNGVEYRANYRKIKMLFPWVMVVFF